MYYEIIDFNHENEQPNVVFEAECDSAEECVDMCLSLLTDMFEIEEEPASVQKLRDGDYEVRNNSIIVRSY